MATLREIIASFTVDMSGAEKGIKQGGRLVDGLVDQLKGLAGAIAGAFAVDAIVGFVGGLFKEADALAKVSAGLGLMPRELQELEHAAGLSGVATEQMRAALARLQKGAADAARGTGEAKDVFAKLGLELKNQDGTLKTTGRLFDEVVEKVSGIENTTERAGLLNKIFGDSYVRLVPLLNEGSEGLRRLRAEVEELGFAYDEAFLENAQAFNDNFDRMKLAIRGVAIQAIGPLLPKLVDFAQKATGLVKSIREWMQNSRMLEAVMIGLGSKAIVAVISKLGGLGGAFQKLVPFVTRALLPLLVLEDMLVFLAGGESVLGDMMDAAFGSGTQEKVRATIGEITAGMLSVVQQSRSDATGFRETWELTLKNIHKEFEEQFGPGLGGVIGGFVEAATDMFFVFTRAVGDGFRGMFRMVAGIGAALVHAFLVVFEEIYHVAALVAAKIYDALAGEFNRAMELVARLAGRIAGLMQRIPGLRSVGEALAQAAQEPIQIDAGYEEREQARRRRRRSELIGLGDYVLDLLRGPRREDQHRPGFIRTPEIEIEGEPARQATNQVAPGVFAADEIEVTAQRRVQPRPAEQPVERTVRESLAPDALAALERSLRERPRGEPLFPPEMVESFQRASADQSRAAFELLEAMRRNVEPATLDQRRAASDIRVAASSQRAAVAQLREALEPAISRPVAPPVAAAPVGGTTQVNDINAPISVTQNIQLPAGTPAETTRRAGREASRGVQDALNPRVIRDALVPVPG